MVWTRIVTNFDETHSLCLVAKNKLFGDIFSICWSISMETTFLAKQIMIVGVL